MRSFENLNLEKVILSNTIKKRQFCRIKTGNQLFTIRRSYHEIIDEFADECDNELKGVYRNHKIKLDEYKKAWLKHLMKLEYSFFLTIKLPHVNQDGFKRTKNRTEALALYKKLLTELEQEFCGRTHWKRNPLHFFGVFEQGKSGFWHIHLAIPSMGDKMNDTYIAHNLCRAITDIADKHNFYNTIIDLRAVHDQQGVCMYMVKELKNEKSLWKDECSMLFTLRDLFKGIKGDRHIIKKSLKTIKLLIKVGLLMRQVQTFYIIKPVQHIKKRLFQKSRNRRSSKKYPATDFDFP